MSELVIQREARLFSLNLSEFISFRQVLYAFVKREFLSKYKRTILGPIWFIVQPILHSLVFTLVFYKFAHIPTNGIPPQLFYFCALLPWTYFSSSSETISNCLITHAYILEKIYFPRLILPVSILISQLMTFALQLAVFLILYMALSGSAFSFRNIWQMPLFLLLASCTSLGVGLWIAALTVRYRDLQYLRDFMFRIWMFLTPIVYPASLATSDWRWLVDVNPMTLVVEGFRQSFFGGASITSTMLSFGVGISLLLLITGLLVFDRVQRTFVDEI